MVEFVDSHLAEEAAYDCLGVVRAAVVQRHSIFSFISFAIKICGLQLHCVATWAANQPLTHKTVIFSCTTEHLYHRSTLSQCRSTLVAWIICCSCRHCKLHAARVAVETSHVHDHELGDLFGSRLRILIAAEHKLYVRTHATTSAFIVVAFGTQQPRFTRVKRHDCVQKRPWRNRGSARCSWPRLEQVGGAGIGVEVKEYTAWICY